MQIFSRGMSLQITNFKKLLETMITCKTFLSSMDSFMSLQITNLKKLLETNTMITCKTFLSGMDPFMSLQNTSLEKLLDNDHKKIINLHFSTKMLWNADHIKRCKFYLIMMLPLDI